MSETYKNAPPDFRQIMPDDPEYATAMAVRAEGDRNFEYYEAHEEELLEQYPGPCAIVVYDGCKVRSFTDFDEYIAFFETLEGVQRSGACVIDHLDPNVAWVL